MVDGALTTLTGNAWGVPANFTDIALLVGTTCGPPYDNVAQLSQLNSNANIDDQRVGC
ncbi:hypothetical protein [Bacillus massiliigorillae]|uniref:hypothetical protein n=1 Tax=Bacillus massiliigorillae TaxID=1243664 RepID=UPI0003A1204B|nr:hypothetical protein [Bacillus massiliigorillae]